MLVRGQEVRVRVRVRVRGRMYIERSIGSISTVRAFRQEFTLAYAIGSNDYSLEAIRHVTNGIPLGCPLSYRFTL
jgi:hypothetical protein